MKIMKVFKKRSVGVRMRKSLLIGVLFLFMISFVVADTIKNTHKIGTNVDLRIPFEVDGGAASSSADCNVTLTYPNETIVFSNSTATNNNKGIFNITLSQEKNIALGWYEWVAFCCDGSKCAGGYGDFKVTTTGGERGFTIFLVLIIGALVLFVFGYYSDIEFLVFFGGILFIVGGVYSMIYGIGDSADLYTRAIAGVIIGMGMVLIVASIYNLSKGEDFGDS